MATEGAGDPGAGDSAAASASNPETPETASTRAASGVAAGSIAEGKDNDDEEEVEVSGPSSKKQKAADGSAVKRGRGRPPKKKPSPPMSDEERKAYKDGLITKLDEELNKMVEELQKKDEEGFNVDERAEELNIGSDSEDDKRARKILEITSKMMGKSAASAKVATLVNKLNIFLEHHLHDNKATEEQAKIAKKVYAHYLMDMNRACGRPTASKEDIDLGDLFIQSIYEKGYGWMLPEGGEHVPQVDSDKPNSIAGLDTFFVFSIVNRNEYRVSKKGRRGWKAERTRFLRGTSIVLVHFLIREYIRGMKKKKKHGIKKPPSSNVAMTIMGFYDPLSMSNSFTEFPKFFWAATGGDHLRAVKEVERLPSLKQARERVQCMMKIWEDKGGQLSKEIAWAWAKAAMDDPSLIGPPPTGETHPDDDEEEEEDDGDFEDEDAFPTPYPADLFARPNKFDFEQMPVPCELHPIDVEKFDFEPYGPDGRDDGAHMVLKKLLEKQFLDGHPISEDVPADRRPIVMPRQTLGNYHPAAYPQRTGEVVVAHNMLSPEGVNAWFALNTQRNLPFIQVADGKYSRPVARQVEGYIQDVGRVRPSFMLSKGEKARFYRCFPGHKFEIGMMDCVQSVARVMVKAKFGEKEEAFINQSYTNANDQHIGKGFGKHDDANETNTDTPRGDGNNNDRYFEEVAPNTRAYLPTVEMMLVITYVLCGPREAIDKDEDNYEVSWYPKSGGEKVASVASARTRSVSMHVQICAQGEFVHDGKVLLPDNHRATLTYRAFMNPCNMSLSMWLRFNELMPQHYPGAVGLLIGDNDADCVYGVLGLLSDPLRQGRPAHAVANQPTLADQKKKRDGNGNKARTQKKAARSILNNPENSDTYRNCPANEIPADVMANLKSVTPVMKYKQRLPDLYMSWEFQQILLKHNILLRVLLYEHNQLKKTNGLPLICHLIPAITRPGGRLEIPAPRTIYPLSVMKRMGHLIWTDKRRPIVSTASKHNIASLLCLHSIFRCERTSGKKAISRSGKGPFRVILYGSGGGATRYSGQAGASMKDGMNPEHQAAAVESHPQQSASKVNSILTRMAENRLLVDVWMTKDLCMELAPESLTAFKEWEGFHLGLGFCYREETCPPLKLSDIRREYDKHLTNNEILSNPHLAYRLWPHKKYTIELLPITPNSLYKKVVLDQRKLKMLTIIDDIDDRATFEIPDVDGKRNVKGHLGLGDDFRDNIVKRHMNMHFEEHFLDNKEDGVSFADRLPLMSSMGNITVANMYTRPDSKWWCLYRKKLHEMNPYGKYVGLKKKVLAKHVLKLMRGMSVVGFKRALNLTLQFIGNKAYNMPLMDQQLGTILRMFHFPHPIRSYDPPVVLCLLLASAKFGAKPDKRDMGDDLFTAIVCHLFGRASGFGHFFKSLNKNQKKECLRPANVKVFTEHIRKMTKDSRGAFARYPVKQYEKQIARLLRKNPEAAIEFLEKIAARAEVLAKGILRKGRTRKEYVMDLAQEMSSLVPNTSRSDFFFVAQHVIATLSEMYEDDRFGIVTLDDVYMGPGSIPAVSVFAFSKSRPEKKSEDGWHAMSDYVHPEEAEFLLKKIRELTPGEKDQLGLYEDDDGKLRVKLTNRLVTYLDLEHSFCKLYLFLKKKSPAGMISVEPLWHSIHCYPVRYNTEELQPKKLAGFEQVAKDAIASFEGSNFEMPWRFLLKSEWPKERPWEEEPLDSDPKYECDLSVGSAASSESDESSDGEDPWDPDEDSEEFGNLYFDDNEPDLIDEFDEVDEVQQVDGDDEELED